MEEFENMLCNVEDSYEGFIVGVMTYVKKKQERFDKVKQFIEDNPRALSSDIIEFISYQDDFLEDNVGTYVEVVSV